jgi:hypothetical protein
MSAWLYTHQGSKNDWHAEIARAATGAASMAVFWLLDQPFSGAQPAREFETVQRSARVPNLPKSIFRRYFS